MQTLTFALLKIFKRGMRAWKKALPALVQKAIENTENAAHSLTLTETRGLVAQLATTLTGLADLAEKGMAGNKAEANALYDTVKMIEIGVAALTLVLLIAGGFYLARSLRGVVSDITRSAGAVSAGSEQLSSTAEQMSQGATEQAAAAEQASSAMEQMAANVKQTAENAGQTERIAKQSADAADESSTAMTQTVQAMRTIAVEDFDHPGNRPADRPAGAQRGRRGGTRRRTRQGLCRGRV